MVSTTPGDCGWLMSRRIGPVRDFQQAGRGNESHGRLDRVMDRESLVMKETQ